MTVRERSGRHRTGRPVAQVIRSIRPKLIPSPRTDGERPLPVRYRPLPGMRRRRLVPLLSWALAGTVMTVGAVFAGPGAAEPHWRGAPATADGANTGQVPPAAELTQEAPDDRARVAVDTALAQIGLPYQWGGDGPAAGDAGFDCSGLTAYAYAAAGISLPRTAYGQYTAGPHLPEGTPLLPGDLVFYGTPVRIEHVGLYVGEGRMVDAPTLGQPVRLAYQRWPGDSYVGATRPAATGARTSGTLDVPTEPEPQTGAPRTFDAPPAPPLGIPLPPLAGPVTEAPAAQQPGVVMRAGRAVPPGSANRAIRGAAGDAAGTTGAAPAEAGPTQQPASDEEPVDTRSQSPAPATGPAGSAAPTAGPGTPAAPGAPTPGTAPAVPPPVASAADPGPTSSAAGPIPDPAPTDQDPSPASAGLSDGGAPTDPVGSAVPVPVAAMPVSVADGSPARTTSPPRDDAESPAGAVAPITAPLPPGVAGTPAASTSAVASAAPDTSPTLPVRRPVGTLELPSGALALVPAQVDETGLPVPPTSGAGLVTVGDAFVVVLPSLAPLSSGDTVSLTVDGKPTVRATVRETSIRTAPEMVPLLHGLPAGTFAVVAPLGDALWTATVPH